MLNKSALIFYIGITICSLNAKMTFHFLSDKPFPISPSRSARVRFIFETQHCSFDYLFVFKLLVGVLFSFLYNFLSFFSLDTVLVTWRSKKAKNKTKKHDVDV